MGTIIKTARAVLAISVLSIAAAVSPASADAKPVLQDTSFDSGWTADVVSVRFDRALEPDSTITVSDGSGPLAGSTRVATSAYEGDDMLVWERAPGVRLTQKIYTVTVSAHARNGDVATVVRSFKADVVKPATPVLPSIMDGRVYAPGEELTIAGRVRDGSLPTDGSGAFVSRVSRVAIEVYAPALGRSINNMSAVVAMISPPLLACDSTCLEGDEKIFSSAVALDPGHYTVRVVAYDLAGNGSAPATFSLIRL